MADVRRLLRHRAERRRSSRFVIETPKLVEEALDAGFDLIDAFVPVDDRQPDELVARLLGAGTDVHGLETELFDSVNDTRSPQGIVAVAALPSLAFDDRFRPGRDWSSLLVLIDVADPGNVGTLLRTAEGAGCSGVVIVGSTADVFSPKVVRASAGSILRVPVAELPVETATSAIEQAGYRPMVTTVEGRPYDSQGALAGNIAIVLGNEAHGLDAAFSEDIEEAVSIPMSGRVESLNVAMAGSILAFEHARQRREQTGQS